MTGPVDPDAHSGVNGSESGPVFAGEEQPLLQGLDVQPDEFQALAKFKSQIEFIPNNNISYLVLGDFSEHPKRRLNLVCSRLSGKPGTSAKTLIKLPNFDELDGVSVEATQSNIQTYLQFQSVARNVSAIVFVAEGRNAGSSVELGRLVPTEVLPNKHPYFQKTYLAVRNYNDLTIDDINSDHPSYDDLTSRPEGVLNLTNPRPYSSPQENMFEIFDRDGRCWDWDTRRSLWEVADEIHKIHK